MEQRLVIPRDMRENVFRAIQIGNAGRDAMLREATDVQWPRIQSEVVVKAQSCAKHQKAGKNLKCVKPQTKIGKLIEAEEPNEKTFINSAGPFQNAYTHKK